MRDILFKNKNTEKKKREMNRKKEVEGLLSLEGKQKRKYNKKEGQKFLKLRMEEH